MFNKRFRILLCVIDIFSKYVWVVPLKDKKGVSIPEAFQKTLDDSNRKPNKIWVIRKDIFACLFSIHNTISLSCHEQVCLSGLRFERYFSHLRAT